MNKNKFDIKHVQAREIAQFIMKTSTRSIAIWEMPDKDYYRASVMIIMMYIASRYYIYYMRPLIIRFLILTLISDDNDGDNSCTETHNLRLRVYKFLLSAIFKSLVNENLY